MGAHNHFMGFMGAHKGTPLHNGFDLMDIMMRLGEFKFSISTAAYQSFSRSTNYRWQAQERFGQLPAQQYTGPGDDSITLSGDIYPSYAGGIYQINDMRVEAEKGEPLLMVDGNGFVWGRWVIQSVQDEQSVFFNDGTARKMAFSLKLAPYVEDIVSDELVNDSPQLKVSDSNSWVNDIPDLQIRDRDSWVNDIKVIRIR